MGLRFSSQAYDDGTLSIGATRSQPLADTEKGILLPPG
jgi:hypothetical protein